MSTCPSGCVLSEGALARRVAGTSPAVCYCYRLGRSFVLSSVDSAIGPSVPPLPMHVTGFPVSVIDFTVGLMKYLQANGDVYGVRLE